MRYLMLCILLSINMVGFAQNPAKSNGEITLEVEASRTVTHDLMQVNMYIEAQGKDQAKVSKEVSDKINAAIEEARKVTAVKVATGSRHSYPIYKDSSYFGSSNISNWRERASINLESKDFTALSNLVVKLLDSLAMENMTFSLSKEARVKLEEELAVEAVNNFMRRASVISTTLKAKKFNLLNMDLTNSSRPYMPQPIMKQVRSRNMALSSMETSAAPALNVEAGNSEFTFIARGNIQLVL